jgi:hypothetical protein
MGDQCLVQVAGEQGDAVWAGVVPEEVAGHADLAAPTGAEHTRPDRARATPRSHQCGRAADGRRGPAP